MISLVRRLLTRTAVKLTTTQSSHSPNSRLLLKRHRHLYHHHVSKKQHQSFCNRSISTTPQCCSSTTDVDDDQGEIIDQPDYDDNAFEQAIESDDDELAHLRVKLYATQNDDTIANYLEQLYEAASIQQVFDIVEESEKHFGLVNLKIASQALVTIWDLQKFIFKISSNFEPERDYFNRPTFINKIGSHPVFHDKIVRTVMQHCDEMEDEALTATLLCLKKMNYSMRSPECDRFVDECVRRKDTLAVGALSRLFVCLRDERLYGNLICAKFQPLLMRHVEQMSTDLEVRLVSISVRNSFRIVSNALIDNYNSKLLELKDKLHTFENVTLCKVFLLLMVTRNRVKPEIREIFDLIGEILIPRVHSLQMMDLLTLQKFLELNINQPYGLVEALVQKMMRTVQEGASSYSSPRLDFLASIAPYMKTVDQKRQMGLLLKQYLDSQMFELASGILYSILRWSKSKDTGLYDQYWSQAALMVESRKNNERPDKRVLRMGKNYINFSHGLGYCYRNYDFERTLKRYYYKLLYNYKDGLQPCVLGPGDISKLYSFLIGMGRLSDPIFNDIELIRILDDFAPQFRASDLTYLAKGVEAIVYTLFNVRNPQPKYYDKLIEVCSIIEEQCARLLMSLDNFIELMAIHKCTLTTRRVKGDSPIVSQSLLRALKCEIVESRSVKDLAQNLMIGRNNFPEAMVDMFNLLSTFKGKSIYPDVVEKFMCCVFTLGWELDREREHEIVEYCSGQLEKNWDKLPYIGLIQASTALCYYKYLPKELVQKIFSVDFLDQIDAELTHLYYGNNYPMRLRTAMMELNRAVCIDMPEANLPWFHEKYCEDLIAMNSPQQPTYFHQEVNNALVNIVGDPASVQKTVYSPYYYKLDFLIEFDEKSRPIKKHPKAPSSNFFQKLREPPPTHSQVQRKVAILLLSPNMFTKNVRSLKGLFKLRRRHLEILGYDVIEIDPKYWNSMFMSENAMRWSFLESKLYARRAQAVG